MEHMKHMNWYYEDETTLCAPCARWHPAAGHIADPARGIFCDLCGRQDGEEDETAQIRQALYLALAQVEHAHVAAAVIFQRQAFMRALNYEVAQSYEQSDAAWKERSRRLLAATRQWLEAYDVSEEGPSILKEETHAAQ